MKQLFLVCMSACVVCQIGGSVHFTSELGKKTTLLSSKEISPADSPKYSGLDCFGVPLGISLSTFEDKYQHKFSFVEQSTQGPDEIRIYSLQPRKPLGFDWSPRACFILENSIFRLYSISGPSTDSLNKIRDTFSERFGNPNKNGNSLVWRKSGTKLEVVSGQRLFISFTHEALLKTSFNYMSKAVLKELREP